MENTNPNVNNILNSINSEYEKLPPEEKLEVLGELENFLNEVLAKKRESLDSGQVTKLIP